MTKKKRSAKEKKVLFSNKSKKVKLKHKIIHHYHRRRHVEEDIPEWKVNILKFNERNFHWLERFVEFMIPWLVLLLAFIIIAEFGTDIAGWFNHDSDFAHMFEALGEWAHHYHSLIIFIDQVIIGFFIVDLYFNFFKKATLWGFFKTYFLDILAITPVGFFMGIFAKQIGGVQKATPIGVDTHRLATRAVKVEKISTRMPKLIRAITRLPRLLRLYRLGDLFVKHKKKNLRKNLKKEKNK